jgi:hypothetical protein
MAASRVESPACAAAVNRDADKRKNLIVMVKESPEMIPQATGRVIIGTQGAGIE